MSTTLNADVREKVGSRHARALRAAGKIPASLQGWGDKPHVNLAIDEEDFLTSRRQHQHLYELQIAGEVETALVNHLDWDVFGERIAHIEFRRVDRYARTDVVVAIEFVGTPKLGLLVHELNELEVRTTPDNIPNSLLVKVGALEPGATITAADVALPEGVELSDEVEPDDVVARVIEPRAEPEPIPEAELEEAAAAAAAAEAAEAPEEGEKAEEGQDKGKDKGKDKGRDRDRDKD